MTTPRAEIGDVKAIYRDTAVADAGISAFILAAHTIVEERLSGLPEETKQQIEAFLACSFMTAQDPLEASEKEGDAQRSFLMPKDGVCPYMRAAIALDSTGQLRNLGGAPFKLSMPGQETGYSRRAGYGYPDGGY